MPRARFSPLVVKAVEMVVRYGRPQAVYVFGSHARGEATGASDLDLLLVYEERAPPAMGRILRQLFAAYPLRVDLAFRSRDEMERAERGGADTFVVTALRSARRVHPPAGDRA